MSDPMTNAVASVIVFSLVIFFFTVGAVVITSEKCNKPAMIFAIITSFIVWTMFATTSGEYIRYMAGM